MPASSARQSHDAGRPAALLLALALALLPPRSCRACFPAKAAGGARAGGTWRKTSFSVTWLMLSSSDMSRTLVVVWARTSASVTPAAAVLRGPLRGPRSTRTRLAEALLGLATLLAQKQPLSSSPSGRLRCHHPAEVALQ